MKNTQFLPATLLIFILGVTNAQNNLVPNPGFEELEKKVKEPGQITLAVPWSSPNLAPADVYSSNAKDPRIGVPDNAYGNEKPFEGENYAGFLAYSYRNAEPRRYLQVELTQPLEAGKKYCVSFKISTADVSKFACNGIGVYFSKEKMTNDNKDPILFDKYLKQSGDPIFDKQFWWTDWCNTYKAEGGETHMIIGNFTPDDKLEIKKLKRPRDIKGQQTNDAYYFIDLVKVEEIQGEEVCDCGLSRTEKITVVERNFQSDLSDTASIKKQIAAQQTAQNVIILKFDKMKFALTPEHEELINPLIEDLKKPANAKKIIEITAHADKSEPENANLSMRRANVLLKYLMSKGIAKNRIKVIDKKATVDPAEGIPGSRLEITVK